MKLKKLFTAMAVTCCAFALTGVIANAENDVVSVTVDNVAVEFDLNPVIIEGHTLVPVRAVFEQAGATVTWDQPTQTATITKDE